MNRSVGAQGITFAGWVTVGDTLTAELMARTGFDWLILDSQHGGVHPGNLLPLLQATDLGGTPALVRVIANDAAAIGRALDQGAAGVIVPMVSSATEAQAAVRAARYPPVGNRSYGRLRTGYEEGIGEPEDPLCFVMIETREGLADVREIAATPGLNGLFVGPADLGLALGHVPGSEVHSEVMVAIGTIVAACQHSGIIPAAASFGRDNAQALLKLGVRLIALGSDAGFMRRGAAAELQGARHWREATA